MNNDKKFKNTFDVGTMIRSNGLLIALVLLFIVMIFTSPVFLTAQNLINILTRSVAMGIMAIGMTFVLISGGLDLSVANVATLSGLFAVRLTTYQGYPTIVGILVALSFGAFIGLLNGAIITRLKVNSLIVTISTMTVILGFIWVYSNGANFAPAPDFISMLTEIKILKIPLIVYIWILLGVIAHLILKYTKLGRNLYAVGDNQDSSRLAGLNVENIQMFSYIASGILSSFAGILIVSRLDAAIPTAAAGLELTVIASVVIGGTSLSGGTGTMYGTFLGVLLISLVSNAINLWGAPAAYDNVFRGAVIGIAALMDAIRKK